MEYFLDTMSHLLPPRQSAYWTDLLPALNRVVNIRSKYRRAGSVQSTESLKDYLCEFRFALVFLSLGFEVHAEPLGDKGPDFLVRRDAREAFVECKRFRKMHDGPSMVSPNDSAPLLEPYGDFERDTKKAFSRILEKFVQVADNEGLICIWNDDEDMEEFEVGAAVEQLRVEAAADVLRIPKGLQAVVYGSDWQRVADGKQVYCYRMRPPETHVLKWLQELDGVNVSFALTRR